MFECACSHFDSRLVLARTIFTISCILHHIRRSLQYFFSRKAFIKRKYGSQWIDRDGNVALLQWKQCHGSVFSNSHLKRKTVLSESIFIRHVQGENAWKNSLAKLFLSFYGLAPEVSCCPLYHSSLNFRLFRWIFPTSKSHFFVLSPWS